jgi:hypothetical protein
MVSNLLRIIFAKSSVVQAGLAFKVADSCFASEPSHVEKILNFAWCC